MKVSPLGGNRWHPGTLYPEFEWFDRNLARLREISDPDYRGAYLNGVRLIRGEQSAAGLEAALLIEKVAA